MAGGDWSRSCWDGMFADAVCRILRLLAVGGERSGPLGGKVEYLCGGIAIL